MVYSAQLFRFLDVEEMHARVCIKCLLSSRKMITDRQSRLMPIQLLRNALNNWKRRTDILYWMFFFFFFLLFSSNFGKCDLWPTLCILILNDRYNTVLFFFFFTFELFYFIEIICWNAHTTFCIIFYVSIFRFFLKIVNLFENDCL